MARSFFARVSQVMVAGLEEAVDTAERSSSLGLMREAMREVERAIEINEREIRTARGQQRDNAEHERRLRDELKALDDNARYALTKDRADLARAAVARQLELETRLKALAEATAAAAREEKRAAGQLATAKQRWQAMRTELAAAEKARQAQAADGSGARADVVEERLQRAEKAFERAAETAAEATGGRIDPAQAADLDAIRALKIDDEIAARLAAMLTPKPARKAPEPKRTARKG